MERVHAQLKEGFFFLRKKIIYLDEREREIERNEGKIGAIGRD